jgi:hypothetical protein
MFLSSVFEKRVSDLINEVKSTLLDSDDFKHGATYFSDPKLDFTISVLRSECGKTQILIKQGAYGGSGA